MKFSKKMFSIFGKSKKRSARRRIATKKRRTKKYKRVFMRGG